MLVLAGLNSWRRPLIHISLLGSKDSVKKTPIKQLIYNGLMKKLSSTVGLGLLKRTLQTSFGPTWKVLYLFFRETLM